MGFAFSPGCPCCCDICDDTFNRPDSTDITTGGQCELQVVAGTWSIVSGTLRVDPFDAPGIATGTEDSADAQMMQVSASVIMPAWNQGQIGDPPNFFLLLSDGAGNDYFAYFKLNSGFSSQDGSISIYKGQPFAGGTILATKTGLNMPPGPSQANPIGNSNLSLCIDSKGILSAFYGHSVVDTSVNVYAKPDAHVGPIPGMGFILPFNGPVKITEFKVTRTNKDEGCTDCGIPCTDCSEKIPAQLQVTFTGWSIIGDPKCADGITPYNCDALNASFLCSFTPSITPCEWSLSGINLCNDRFNPASIAATYSGGKLTVSVAGPNFSAVFQKTITAPVDCAQFDVDVPLVGSPVAIGCIANPGATCHVKAI